MKKLIKLVLLVLIIVCLYISCNQTKDSPENIQSKFSELHGPYLGQIPPGDTVKIFAPGYISTGLNEGMILFNKGGTELFFSAGISTQRLGFFFHTALVDGKWTEPVEFPMARDVFFRSVLSPDGKRVYCISSRYGKNTDDEEGLIKFYYFERTPDGWSQPKLIDFGDNFPYDYGHLSVAESGNIYFQTGYRIYGNEDIYFAKFENGKYHTPVKLGESINGPGHDLHPYIAPDESFLIFDANREGGYGKNDLYISFRNENGEWTKAINMGPKVNSERDERRSSVSPDGKYLFFESATLEKNPDLLTKPVTLHEFIDYSISYENGSKNMYWIDAKVIDELKQDNLK